MAIRSRVSLQCLASSKLPVKYGVLCQHKVADTIDVLTKLGYTADEIDALIAQNVVKASE